MLGIHQCNCISCLLKGETSRNKKQEFKCRCYVKRVFVDQVLGGTGLEEPKVCIQLFRIIIF